MNLKSKSARAGTHWIGGALNPAHRGMLHEKLGIPMGKKIPVAKLKEAAKGNSPTAKRARLAITLRSFH